MFTFLDPRLYDISLIEKKSYLNFAYSYVDIHSSLDFLIMEFVSIFCYGLPITAGPLWFVLTLFFVSVLFFVVYSIFKNKTTGVIIYALLCLTIGWLCNSYNIWLPCNFSTVFTSSFFFSLGYLTKKIVVYLTEITKIKLLLIIIVLLPIYLYAINVNGVISLIVNSLGNNFFCYVLSTVGGVFLIVGIFIYFNKFITQSILQGILRNIARNALIILSTHYWVILCCKIFLDQIASKSYFPWLVTLIMIIITALAIPLFRTKLYKLIGKEKITFKESISIK